MFSSLPSEDWPKADLLRCCSVFMTRQTLLIACSCAVNGMHFDPLKLFIMCRQEALLRSRLTQLWQLLRDGRGVLLDSWNQSSRLTAIQRTSALNFAKSAQSCPMRMRRRSYSSASFFDIRI